MNLQIRVNTSGALLSGKAPAIVQNNLDRAITEATLFLDAKVKANTPQGVSGAQGGLLGSIQHDVTGRGTPLIKGVVMSAHKYAEVIEKGRRPGKGLPRADVLRGWIEKKLGITNEKDYARVNFLIRRKIRRHGFKGAHMFEKALNENFSQVQSIFKNMGLTIVRELSE